MDAVSEPENVENALRIPGKAVRLSKQCDLVSAL